MSAPNLYALAFASFSADASADRCRAGSAAEARARQKARHAESVLYKALQEARELPEWGGPALVVTAPDSVPLIVRRRADGVRVVHVRLLAFASHLDA